MGKSFTGQEIEKIVSLCKGHPKTEVSRILKKIGINIAPNEVAFIFRAHIEEILVKIHRGRTVREITSMLAGERFEIILDDSSVRRRLKILIEQKRINEKDIGKGHKGTQIRPAASQKSGVKFKPETGLYTALQKAKGDIVPWNNRRKPTRRKK